MTDGKNYWILAALLAFYLAGNFVWNFFYSPGQLIGDSGWQAGLLWHNDYRLLHPPAVLENATLGTSSMHEIHFSPLIVLFTYLSYLFPFQPEEWLSIFMALATATLAASFSLGAGDFLRVHRRFLPGLPIIATAAGLILAFNPITGNILVYPHFEIWIPAFLTLFLWAFITNHRKTAIVSFFMLLSVREDAGFHLCAILWTVVAWRTLTGVFAGEKFKKAIFKSRAMLLWSGVAFAYSAACLVILGVFFSLPVKTFDVGDLGAHLLSIITRREWVYAFSFLILAAALFRRWDWLLGLVSCIPWVLYNAATPSGGEFTGFAATLQIYYAFPLIIALFFPLISHRFVLAPANTETVKRRRLIPLRHAPWFLLLFVAVSLIRQWEEPSTLRNTLPNLLTKGAAPPPLQARKSIAAVSDFLHTGDKNAISDGAFASFRPYLFQREQQLGMGNKSLNICGGDYLITGGEQFVYMKNVVYTAVRNFGLKYVYHLQETGYYLFSHEKLCDNNGECVWQIPLTEVAVGEGAKKDMINSYHTSGMSFPGCIMSADAGRREKQTLIVEEGGKSSLLLTDLPMLEGHYLIDLYYSYQGGGVPKLSVLSDDGNFFWHLPGGETPHIQVEASFLGTLTTATIAVNYPGEGRLAVKAIGIRGVR